MKAASIILAGLALAQLAGCSMTPERRQAMAQAMSNYHPYMLPPVEQAPKQTTTTTNCWTPSPGNVSCTSQTH